MGSMAGTLKACGGKFSGGGCGGRAGAGWDEPNITLKEEEEFLTVHLEGHWYADLLLEELGPVVRASCRAGRLVLDFRSTLGLDDLALSAVVVLLRTYCQGFNTIDLRLHQPWALTRLMEHGARRVLGPAWAAGFESGLVRFNRRDM